MATQLRVTKIPLLRRWGYRLLIVGCVITLNFMLPRMLPGNPLLAMTDPNNGGYLADPANYQQALAYYGLDRPIREQYRSYLVGLFTGDLGWSIRLKQPVAQLIWSRIGWTLALVVPATLLAGMISIRAGVNAGWQRGRRADSVWIAVFTLVSAIPGYLLAVLAILVFAVNNQWLPMAGAVSPFGPEPWTGAWLADVARHWVLPFTVLTVSALGARFLLARNSMSNILGEPFLVVVLAKGLPRERVKDLHAGRNAMVPVLTELAAALAFSLGGSILIETIFAYPGMGLLMQQSVTARDYPVLQGCFLVTSFAVLLSNWTMNWFAGRIDPRLRGGS